MSRNQGLPQRPYDVLGFATGAILERYRERTADIRRAIYVRPVGPHLHLVKNFCNDTQYLVSGIPRSPGAQVLLGSNSGHPGETIIAEPPPEGRGSSLFGAVTTGRNVAQGNLEPSCPLHKNGYEYIGFRQVLSPSPGTFNAWRYRDATFKSRVGQVAAPTAGVANKVIYVPALHSFAMIRGKLVTIWNLTANTTVETDRTGARTGSFALVGLASYGGDVYWLEFKNEDPMPAWVMKMTSGGTVSQITPTTPAGIENTTHNGSLLADGAWFSGATWVSLVTDSGDPQAPADSEAGYVRHSIVTGLGEKVKDYAVFDEHSGTWASVAPDVGGPTGGKMLIDYSPSGNERLVLVRPYKAIIPASWAWNGSSAYPSPGGADVIMYDVNTTPARLCRLALQTWQEASAYDVSCNLPPWVDIEPTEDGTTYPSSLYPRT